MTEHSVKELKRQMLDAQSRLSKAKQDYLVAERRYQEARVRQTGLFNKVIRTKKHSILIQDIEFLSGEPWCAIGFLIKKNGVAGRSEGRIYLNSEKYDVLPYSVEAAA